MASQEYLKKKALAAEKRGKVVLESKLQSECVLWWKNTYPSLSNRLFAVFNEGRDVTHKLSMGLTPGVCDLLYVGLDGRLFGFELKQRDSHHLRTHLIQQAEWMLTVLPRRAWFCDSLDGFKEGIFGNISYLLEPRDVLDYCRTKKTKYIQWNEISDYLRERKTSV